MCLKVCSSFQYGQQGFSPLSKTSPASKSSSSLINKNERLTDTPAGMNQTSQAQSSSESDSLQGGPSSRAVSGLYFHPYCKSSRLSAAERKVFIPLSWWLCDGFGVCLKEIWDWWPLVVWVTTLGDMAKRSALMKFRIGSPLWLP